MTTCVVVKKDGEVAIAADSLVTFGDTRLARGYEQNQKIFQVGDSLIALAGTTAHFPVMRSLLAGLADECRLGTRDDVYESSQITCLIANPTGIYGVYSYREVFSFDRFWGIGSGRNFALGAMSAVFDMPGKSAADVAQVGVSAGVEFDKSSGGPIEVHTVRLQD